MTMKIGSKRFMDSPSLFRDHNTVGLAKQRNAPLTGHRIDLPTQARLWSFWPLLGKDRMKIIAFPIIQGSAETPLHREGIRRKMACLRGSGPPAFGSTLTDTGMQSSAAHPGFHAQAVQGFFDIRIRHLPEFDHLVGTCRCSYAETNESAEGSKEQSARQNGFTFIT